MLTIATVLKSGGEYRPAHVLALKQAIADNLKTEHRFVCLSDIASLTYEVIRLEHGWPGWWSKIELFRPGLFNGPVVYFDLDTVVVGNIDDMMTGHVFTVLESFWTKARIGSGLMAWDCDLSSMYDVFRADPDRHIKECVTKANWGDQGFITHHWPFKPDRWQDIFPRRIVSYKLGCVQGKPPKGASIVCYHGAPRPWETRLWRPAT